MKPAAERWIKHLARGGDYTDTSILATTNYSVPMEASDLLGIRLTCDVSKESEHGSTTGTYAYSRSAAPTPSSRTFMGHFKVEHG